MIPIDLSPTCMSHMSLGMTQIMIYFDKWIIETMDFDHEYDIFRYKIR